MGEGLRPWGQVLGPVLLLLLVVLPLPWSR